MNFLSIIAFLLAGAVLGFGVLTAGNAEMFLSEHAALIVLGGTVAAAAISFQIDRIFLLLRVFFRRVIQGRKQNYVKLIETLIAISEAYRLNSGKLNEILKSADDPFLSEAVGLLQEDVFDEPTLIRIMRTRANTIFQRQTEDVIKFRTIGKFPPAFGLMGTTLSMIALLQKLGQAGGQKLIGPAMAVGLVATFYGIALANLVFIPIAENLGDSSKETRLKNMIIVEGVRLILKKTNPVVLAEELNSFLLVAERIDWKKVSGTGNGAAADRKNNEDQAA